MPKNPPIIEDLSFTFLSRTPIGSVIEEIKKTSETVRNVELIDSYQNTKTFRITYQHPEKSLTDKEVGKVRERIIEKINQKFQGKLKG